MRTFSYAALRTALLTVVGVCAVACGAAGEEEAASSEAAATAPPKLIVLQLDPKIPAPVGDRIESLVRETAHGVGVKRVTGEVNQFASGDHVLAIGDVAAARDLIHDDEAQAIPSEGFIVRSVDRNGAHIMAARGTDASEKAHYARPNRGMLYGAYAALGHAGFGFLHPLAPTKPAQFAIPTGIDQHESPRWHVRGMHLHTMHPLELTNVLNGWGKTGPNDAAGFDAMVPEWDRFLEWMLANRQNKVEWLLLESKSWESFSTSETRSARLKTLVDHAHTYGIDAGADTPIALTQQHSFRLVMKQGELADELASIRSRIGWLMKAGFDFLATENGTTEFTHADPDRMLAWMNEVARTMSEDHDGRSASIKIHCSTGQTAEGFTDPATGQPLNVNMLPHYADERLGVLPHTVEHYGLDDPAPTYGNVNFDYMRKFLRQEAGHRETVWHPETAYWVSFDVDVPLFLPLYGERRVHDIRLLAKDEQGGAPMDGQMIFSSGWEWGYWLNDVIAARSAWNPHEEAANDEEATRAILDEAFGSFGPNRRPVIDALLGWMKDEKELLIYGRHDGQTPSDIVSRNGQAYLQGWEVWDDVPAKASKLGIKAPKTQPDKLGLVDMRVPGHSGPKYSREIEPLLAAMEKQFGARATQLATALEGVAPTSKELADELNDSSRITVLRAKQVHGLYDYVDGYWDSMNPFSSAGQVRKERLKVARAALDDAQKIVDQRERRYRVEQQRIGGWGENPTAYDYGYLWTVHSLMYWWRDEGKAVDAPISPCYLNIVNPAEVAFGEGTLHNMLKTVQDVFDKDSALGGITECMAGPTREPKFPQDNLRSRP